MTHRAYTTGVLGDKVKEIVDNIVTDAVALGWARVESAYVQGTVTWEVLRNPSSLNYFGGEFHIALGYDTASKTHMYASLFEGWDTSSKMASKYAPWVTNSIGPYNADFSNPRSPSHLFSTGSGVFTLIASNIVDAENYWYSITADRLALSVAANSSNNGTKAAWYVGAYERFLTSSVDPCPVVITWNSGAAGGSQARTEVSSAAGSIVPIGAATREPLALVHSVGNFAAGWKNGDNVYTTGCFAWTPFGLSELGRTDTTAARELYTQRPFVSRIPVTGRGADSLALRGLLIDMYIIGDDVTTAHGAEARWTFAANTYAATKMRGGNAVRNAWYMGKV